MTQPPNQPPQGGFGAPQDQPPSSRAAAPPQRLRRPADAAAAAAGPARPGAAARLRLPAAARPLRQQPQQPGPYGQPGQPGPLRAAGPVRAAAAARPRATAARLRLPAAAPVPRRARHPAGGGSRNPFKGKPALVVGAAVAALLVIGGTVFAVTSGGDDGEKKPVAETEPTTRKPSRLATPRSTPATASGDGGEDPEDLNAGRKAGEAKVLWYKEAPDAPGSGADAPGMWITDKTAVKAAYKQLVRVQRRRRQARLGPDHLPAEDLRGHPAEDRPTTRSSSRTWSGTSDRAKCNQLQQIDLDTGDKGWTGEVAEGALFDSTLSVELSVTGNTLMVGRSQSGTAYDVSTGKKLFDKKKYGDVLLPGRRSRAAPG